MNVPPEVLAHKTLMISLVDLARRVAGELGLAADMSVTAMSRDLDASRTSVYEQESRVIQALVALVAAGPGRPPVVAEPSAAEREQALQLTIRVQAFQLEHPDAIISYPSRTAYSSSFRRFILDELDVWPTTRTAFAEAAGLPIDTLSDWVDDDRKGLSPPPADRAPIQIPVDASETTRSILENFQAWESTTRPFLTVAARRFGLTTTMVAKVLRICGAISSRPKRPFRHRGTTKALSPGSMLVIDGKTLDIELVGSGRRITKNWQGIVEQTTGCDTAAVISDHEGAEAVREAFFKSVEFLGGVPPEGLLHDNKPCYEDAGLRRAIEQIGTLMVAATPARPENKAILEGAFGLFEARIGTIRLDDTNIERLIHTALSELIRVYTAALNAVPRPDLGGLSREAALRTARPSADQLAADRAFIRNLKTAHEADGRADWRKQIKHASRMLLDQVFARLDLEHLDPYGRLRDYLATYEPAAIRQAAAIVAVRRERGHLKLANAHRYLTKLIQSTQESLDLERYGVELLALTRLQGQDWVSEGEAEYEALQRECDSEALATAVAARAAWGGLPVAGAFWTEKLLEVLDRADHLIERVRCFLIRLYEAPLERRLLLLDRLAAIQVGVV